MKLRVNKTVYLAAIVILAIIGSVFFIYLPYQKKNAEQLKTLNEERVDLTLLKEQAQKIGTSDISDALAKADKQINTYFLDKTNILTFISSLEDTAEKHSVVITINLDEFPDTSSDDIIEQPISLELVGGYSAIIDFLVELESQNHYIVFRQFNASATSAPTTDRSLPSAQPSATSEALRVTLNGLSYWR